MLLWRYLNLIWTPNHIIVHELTMSDMNVSLLLSNLSQDTGKTEILDEVVVSIKSVPRTISTKYCLFLVCEGSVRVKHILKGEGSTFFSCFWGINLQPAGFLFMCTGPATQRDQALTSTIVGSYSGWTFLFCSKIFRGWSKVAVPMEVEFCRAPIPKKSHWYPTYFLTSF